MIVELFLTFAGVAITFILIAVLVFLSAEIDHAIAWMRGEYDWD